MLLHKAPHRVDRDLGSLLALWVNTNPDKMIPTKMLDFRPHLDFFKVVELEISCLGSRSKNPELEYVSSYDTFHFGQIYTLREVHEISTKSNTIASRGINSRDFQAKPSGQIEDTILIFNSPEYQNLWLDMRSNPSGQSFFNFSKCVLSGGKTYVFPSILPVT